MKNYAVEHLHPGMRTAKSVYTTRGQLIVEANTELTPSLISRLLYYGISTAAIDDAVMSEDKPHEHLSDSAQAKAPVPHRIQSASHSQQVKLRPKFMAFQVEYSKKLNVIQDSFSSVTNSDGEIDTHQILAETVSLFSESTSTIELFDMLHNMRQVEDSIYAHCLNVSLISRVMGEWLNFSERDLETLTLAALLHDIGKTALPKELINKPAKYTDSEFTIVQQHTLLGYKFLKELPLDIHVKRAALMHHERCDGSGYPQGLKDDAIDPFAQIIAIADVYDAMTAARSYRSPLCPFQVIDAFEKEGLQKYHPEYILTFLKRIANTYQHNRVLLNTGQVGTIFMINPNHLTKPMLQMDDNTIIDMTDIPTLEITRVL